MSLEKTLLLGFIAGVTILIGLPIGRIKRPAPRMRVMLNAIAVGILLFLVWDVLSAAWEPIDEALSDFHAGDGGLGSAFGYGLLFTVGLSVGLLSLVAYERWMDRVTKSPDASIVDDPTLDPAPVPLPPGGAVAVAQKTAPTRGLASWSRPKQLALL